MLQRSCNQTSSLTQFQLNGGPGASSVSEAVSGGTGPCKVLKDSVSTELNDFSWNRVSNMLYVDQPANTGYSFDQRVPGTINQLTGEYVPGGQAEAGNWTTIQGVFPSFDPASGVNTTRTAARGMRAFLEIWMEE